MCLDGVRSYTCQCNTGYYGTNCEHNDCEGVSCPTNHFCDTRTGQCEPPCYPNCQPLGGLCSLGQDCDSVCCGRTAGQTSDTCQPSSVCN
jgi:hypothetical protein